MSNHVTNTITCAMANFVSHPGDVCVPESYLGDLIHDGAHIHRLVAEGVTDFVWVLRSLGTHICPDRSTLINVLDAFGRDACTMVRVKYEDSLQDATCTPVSDPPSDF